MHFDKGYIYHVYNRSNQKVFFDRSNYIFFLSKIRKHIFPIADIFSYCLMPNHFHLLILINDKGLMYVPEKHRPNTQQISKQIGVVLSGYTQAINKKYNRKGSLFSHQTEAKLIDFVRKINLESISARNCIFYIHNNPVEAGLVKRMEDWEFSSFRDFVGLRNGTLINKDLALQVSGLNEENFYKESLIL